MKPKEINTKIHDAFSRLIPDVRETVLSDCEKAGRTVLVVEQEPKAHPWRRRAAAMAACLVLLAGGLGGYFLYKTRYAVESQISLDVNPAIEIAVNHQNRVLGVTARNADGQKVVGDTDYSGNSLELTVSALVETMLRQGYLSDWSNAMLVSVSCSDPALAKELQEQLTGEIDRLLQSSALDVSVIGQTLQADDSLQELADTYHITLGKAQMVKTILKQNTDYTAAELAAMSIDELDRIAQGTDKDGQPDTDSEDIGEEKAKAAAFANAGVSEDEAEDCEVKRIRVDEDAAYDIQFEAEGFAYRYRVGAATGEILKRERRRIQKSTTTTTAATTTTTTTQTEPWVTAPPTTRPQGLSVDKESAIKEAYVRQKKFDGEQNITVDDVQILEYFGEYKNCTVVYLTDGSHTAEVKDVEQNFDGIILKYHDGLGPPFMVYREDGRVKELADAYQAGWIGRDAIESIKKQVDAWEPYTGPDYTPRPMTPETLSQEKKREIEKAYAALFDAGKATVQDYLGTYHGCTAVQISADNQLFTQSIVKQRIAGYLFHFNSSQGILLYKDGKFANVASAYNRGWIDQRDVRDILWYYNGV